MSVVLILLVLALVIGGLGLFIEGLKWLLIIALVLLAASLVSSLLSRRGRA